MRETARRLVSSGVTGAAETFGGIEALDHATTSRPPTRRDTDGPVASSHYRFDACDGVSPVIAHRTSCGCLDRRRERATIACPCGGGPAKDQPVPTVVRCRERQQDVAPRQ